MKTCSRSTLIFLTISLLVSLGSFSGAQVVPATDPEPDQPVPELLKSVRTVHPRLLFGPEEIPAIRALYNSEAGASFKEHLLELLKTVKVPTEKPAFLHDATDGQRQGLWRLPTVALHYVLTGEQESLDTTVQFMRFLLDLPSWETTGEKDSGMSAGNVMIGAALAFDWTYNDLEPAFREAFRKRLIYQARAMYHGGHMMKNPGTHYWQNDPANNHRWHRNAGMVLCTLAAADGTPGQDWILSKLIPEMNFITQWLPDDGTCHEGPGYLVFGNTHLTLGVQAMDRCLGTHYLESSYFSNVARFFVHMLQPGMQEFFPIGDAAGLTGNYAPFLYEAIAVNQQSDLQAAIEQFRSVNPDPLETFSWLSLIWYDASLTGGSLDNVPKKAFFEDIGVATMRTGWDSKDVGALFTCGPFGGYALNAFRNATTPRRFINVAHDDPDANSFLISMGGELMAETDRYSKHKKSANHNTILINGTGQTTQGEPEGQVWSQPGTGDNTGMAVITGWRQTGNTFAIEGEAAGSYPALSGKNPRPQLQRYRRVFLWMEGEYILILDDIRAPEKVDIDWLVQGPKLVAADNTGHYRLIRDDVICNFQVVATTHYKSSIATSSADHRGKALGWEQLHLTSQSSDVRLASVFDPWNTGDLSVTILDHDEQGITVTVAGHGIADTWMVMDGASPDTASTVHLKRNGKLCTVLAP